MVQGEGRSYLQAAYFQVTDENILFSLSQYLAISVRALKYQKLYLYCICTKPQIYS